MERLAEIWAKRLKTSIDHWLGSGDFGEAYITTCGRVIKITNDKSELAFAEKLLDSNNDHLVKVHDLFVFGNGQMGIFMDYLDTCNHPIEDVFNQVMDAADEFGISINELLEMDEDDMQFTDEALKMFNDLYAASWEARKAGYELGDIHGGNLGINDKGDYVLFDQQPLLSMGSEYAEYEEAIERIKHRNRNRNHSHNSTLEPSSEMQIC